jgi:hypothetical protein
MVAFAEKKSLGLPAGRDPRRADSRSEPTTY